MARPNAEGARFFLKNMQVRSLNKRVGGGGRNPTCWQFDSVQYAASQRKPSLVKYILPSFSSGYARLLALIAAMCHAAQMCNSVAHPGKKNLKPFVLCILLVKESGNWICNGVPSSGEICPQDWVVAFVFLSQKKNGRMNCGEEGRVFFHCSRHPSSPPQHVFFFLSILHI